jgi:hypothetical protein
MVQFIKNFLNDKHGFFTIDIILCSSLLLTLSITDTITTLKGLSMGLREINPIMIYIVEFPIIFIGIKIFSGIVSIMIFKQLYDFLKINFPTQKYNDVLLYIAFALPSGILLSTIINNLSVISHYL